MPLLQIHDLVASYHGVPALHVDELQVNAGELVSLIGPNGAGKTTLLQAISRRVDTRGQILFDGRDLTRCRPSEVIRLGVIQCPQGRRLFPNLTVQENLELGAYVRTDRQEIARDLAFVHEIFPLLYERRRQLAGTLSGGEQQMCTIGRALMGRPRLLLLDEPSFGLAPAIVERIAEVISDLRKKGLTILLVEQNAALALAVSDRTYILENGTIARHGPSRELVGDAAVRQAYLGMV